MMRYLIDIFSMIWHAGRSGFMPFPRTLMGKIHKHLFTSFSVKHVEVPAMRCIIMIFGIGTRKSGFVPSDGHEQKSS